MTTAVLEPRTHQFDVEDIEYLRHGDKPLLARVFRPRGEGPFPALVECHGGAWCLSDRTTECLRHEAMAKNGIVSIALDFRSGNEDPYPSPSRIGCTSVSGKRSVACTPAMYSDIKIDSQVVAV
jgi:acetyl esterase